MKRFVVTIIIIVVISPVWASIAPYDPARQASSMLSQKNYYLESPDGYRVLIDPLGSKAPEFRPQTTIDDRSIPMREPDEITIWHFYSPTCPVCEEEVPALQAFAQAYENDVRVIAVGVGDDLDANMMLEFNQRFNLNPEILNMAPPERADFENPVVVMGVFIPYLSDLQSSRYDGEIPVTFIIDQNGIIQFIRRGKVDWNLDNSLERIVIEELRGETELAQSLLDDLVASMDNASATDLNAMAWHMAESEFHLDEARNFAEKAVSLEPDDPYALGTLGAIQYLLGDYYTARFTLEKAVLLHSHNEPKATDTFYLGLTNFALGDYCDSRELLIESVKLHDNSPSALIASVVLQDMRDMLLPCFLPPNPVELPFEIRHQF